MKNWFIFIFVLLLLCCNCAKSSSGLLAREKYRNENNISTYELNEIKSLEKILFNYSFDNDPVLKRLERLETRVFNVTSTDNYKNRLTALKSALNGSNSYSYSYSQPYYNFNALNPYFNSYRYAQPYGVFNPNGRLLRPINPYGSKLHALKNLRSYLRGTMTGYTLPIQNNVYNAHYPNPSANTNFFSNGGNRYEYVGNGFSYYNDTTNDGGINVKIID